MWPELKLEEHESQHEHLFEGSIGDELNPCLKLESWQRRALLASLDPAYGEVALCGSTGCGKGFVVGGLILNVLFDIYDEIRIHITSETFSHAQNNLFGEFTMWHKRMKYPRPCNTTGKGYGTGERHYIRVLNPKPESGEAFSGRHGRRVIYVFDECSSAPKVWVENALKNASFIFYLSNPRVTVHWFRDLFKPTNELTGVCTGDLGKRLNLQIGGPDCTNVKEKRLRKPVGPIGGIEIDGVTYAEGEETPMDVFKRQEIIIPGQTDIGKHRATMSVPEEWKRNCFGLGKFPYEDPELQVILSSWLEFHHKAYENLGGNIPVEAFGLDAARSQQGDPCVLACGGAKGLNRFIDWHAPTYKESASKVIDIAASTFDIDLKAHQHPVCIDYGGGYGAGIGEFLQEAGVWVVPFHPGGSALYFPKSFMGARTESYALLGRRLSPMDFWGDEPFAIPRHDLLIQELVAPSKIFPKNDMTRFKLESKVMVKEKLHGRSPDFADSLTYLFWIVFQVHKYYEVLSKFRGLGGVTSNDDKMNKSGSGKGAANSDATASAARSTLTRSSNQFTSAPAATLSIACAIQPIKTLATSATTPRPRASAARASGI